MKTILSHFVATNGHKGFSREMSTDGYLNAQATTHMQACGVILLNNCRTFDKIIQFCGWNSYGDLEDMLQKRNADARHVHDCLNAVLNINNLIDGGEVETLSDNELNSGDTDAVADYVGQAAHSWEETSTTALAYHIDGAKYTLKIEELYRHGQVWWDWLKDAWLREPAVIERWINACVEPLYLEEGFDAWNQWVAQTSEIDKHHFITTSISLGLPFKGITTTVVHEEPVFLA